MPSFAVTLAHAVYAALGTYPLREIHKLPQLISGELERPPLTAAFVKAFRDEYESEGAPAKLQRRPLFRPLTGENPACQGGPLAATTKDQEPPEDCIGFQFLQ